MAKPTPRAATPAQAVQTVKALVPVNYDHAHQEPGDTFEVRTDDLEQLLEVKAVELVDVADAPAA